MELISCLLPNLFLCNLGNILNDPNLALGSNRFMHKRFEISPLLNNSRKETLIFS